MQAIVEGDNAKFNDYLVAALEGHKEYYGTKENAMATLGWLSMRILAACTMAVDGKGFAIEVESEYIPRWLYMGEGIMMVWTSTESFQSLCYSAQLKPWGDAATYMAMSTWFSNQEQLPSDMPYDGKSEKPDLV